MVVPDLVFARRRERVAIACKMPSATSNRGARTLLHTCNVKRPRGVHRSRLTSAISHSHATPRRSLARRPVINISVIRRVLPRRGNANKEQTLHLDAAASAALLVISFILVRIRVHVKLGEI